VKRQSENDHSTEMSRRYPYAVFVPKEDVEPATSFSPRELACMKMFHELKEIGIEKLDMDRKVLTWNRLPRDLFQSNRSQFE